MEFFKMIFGAISVETPKYTLLTKKEYEIRQYHPRVVITTPMTETNSAFGQLAGFIFGKQQQGPAKPIAMTAPVITDEKTMSFVLPSEYDSIEKVPEPKGPIQIHKKEDF
jgi:hypothetical protein